MKEVTRRFSIFYEDGMKILYDNDRDCVVINWNIGEYVDTYIKGYLNAVKDCGFTIMVDRKRY